MAEEEKTMRVTVHLMSFKNKEIEACNAEEEEVCPFIPPEWTWYSWNGIWDDTKCTLQKIVKYDLTDQCDVYVKPTYH
jgi:hypothetical protein